MTIKFVANLPLSLSAKKFRKSVNIWGSYEQECSVLFFDSRCRLVYRTDRQALSTARFFRAGQLATAETCIIRNITRAIYSQGHVVLYQLGVQVTNGVF